LSLFATALSLSKCRYGIVFFGTPHRGGNHAQAGNVVARIARAILRSENNSLIEALRKDTFFSNIGRKDFQEGIEDFYYISFYEDKAIPGLGYVSNHATNNVAILIRILLMEIEDCQQGI
jgi:hypothetical protein